MYKPSYGYCIIMLIMIFGVTACGSTSINNYKSEKTVSVKDESTWNYRSEKVEKAQNIASADPESLQDDDFESHIDHIRLIRIRILKNLSISGVTVKDLKLTIEDIIVGMEHIEDGVCPILTMRSQK